VADRENGRVQVLFYNGTPIYDVKPSEKFMTVYSTDYCHSQDTIFLLPGEKPRTEVADIEAFAVDPKTRLVAYSWKPTSDNFDRPHILRVSKDCRYVFVGEIRGDGGVLWKFEIKRDRPNQSSGTESDKMDHQHLMDMDHHNMMNMDLTKPTEVAFGDQLVEGRSLKKLLLILSVGVGVPLLLIALVCLCLRIRKRGGLRAMDVNSVSDRYFKDKSFGNSRIPFLNGSSRSHKGFQPLSTEDVDAIDDLTEDSETEDTLYPTNVAKRNPAPLNA